MQPGLLAASVSPVSIPGLGVQPAIVQTLLDPHNLLGLLLPGLPLFPEVLNLQEAKQDLAGQVCTAGTTCQTSLEGLELEAWNILEETKLLT